MGMLHLWSENPDCKAKLTSVKVQHLKHRLIIFVMKRFHCVFVSTCFKTAVVLIRLTQYDSWKKTIWSTEHSCLNQTRCGYLKNPSAAEGHAETLHTFQFPSSSPHFNPLPQHTHAHTHACTRAASHWSCKLCLKHVYAPFLQPSPVIDQLQRNQLQAF